MFVRLLGTVGAGIDDRHVVAAPGRVAGAVLCHLALAGGRAVPTGGLIDLVWPTATPTARNAIQVAISRLRKLYGADLIDSDAGGYRLPASLLRVDLADAEQLARISRDALEAGRPIEALDAAERAEALFVGDPLTGIDPLSATAAIARAGQLRVENAVCVARALLTLGRADEAARRLQASVVRQQLDEPSHAVLMRSLAEAGRPAEALRLYADLRRRLADELGVDPSAEVQDVFRLILQTDLSAADRPILRPEPTVRLPVQGRPMFGREEELGELVGRLSGGFRLVTVVGPGGVGKTRLAIAAGDRASRELGWSVYFADLSVADGPAVVPTVAASINAVGLDVGAAIAGRDTLIVLDNAEHVPDEAAECCRRLLAVPSCRVLITSRRALGLADELVVPLGPMPVRSADDAGVRLLTALCGYGAEEQASRRSELIRLAAGADGIPLVLEIVASALRAESPAALADQLDRVLPELRHEARDRPARHISVSRAMEWNLASAGAGARRALGSLMVHRGSFSLRSAIAVLAATEPPSSARRLLAELVDLSLIQRQPEPEGIRFRILEPIRMAAGVSGRVPPPDDEIRTAHARYYLRLVGEAAADPETSDDVIRRLLRSDDANVRLALSWLWPLDPEATVVALGPLLWSYFHLMRTDVVLDWSGTALGSDDLEPSALVQVAIARYSTLSWFRPGDADIAELGRLVDRHADLLDDEWHARWITTKIEYASNQGDVERAVALRGHFRSGCPGQEVYRLHIDVLIAGEPDRLDEALEAARALLRSPSLSRDSFFRSAGLVNYGYFALTLERFDEARAALDAAFELSVRMGVAVGAIRVNRAWLELGSGQPTTALELIAEILREPGILAEQTGRLEAVLIAGLAMSALGLTVAADRMAAAASAIVDDIGPLDAIVAKRWSELRAAVEGTTPVAPPTAADLDTLCEVVTGALADLGERTGDRSERVRPEPRRPR